MMARWQRILVAAAAACAIASAFPVGASASGSQETLMQDDTYMIYAPPAQVRNAMVAMRDLGVDRIRISVVWGLIAPSPNAGHQPKFDARNPNAYPQGAWARYDTVVQLAKQLGLKVYFQLTAPAPKWATTPRGLPQGYRWSHNPSAKEFGQFVEAVARRYKGLVNYYAIWNEPNIGGWMTPQWTLKHHVYYPTAAAIYRGLVDAAWHGLRAAGDSGDTILIGETAAYGFPWKGYGADLSPIRLLRALYCVDSHNKPLRGSAARNISCPASGSRGAFVRAHPGLFDATGWAHHPYDFQHAPSHHLKDPLAADLADLSRLERALDGAQGAYRHGMRMPLYLTEYGYQSNPPDPFVHFSLADQAGWLNEAEYMAWRDPRVRAFGQFLLIDSQPFSQYRKGSRAYWSSFQSGLIETDGTLKPSYHAFQLPLWLPNGRHGSSVTVWGQLRPADHHGLQTGELEFAPSGSSTFAPLAGVQTQSSAGFFEVHIPIGSAGQLRLAWTDPASGTVEYSRTAAVS